MKRLEMIWREKGVTATLLIACFLLLLLQCWRPLFFLTDDSFSLVFPVWVSIGQKLWAGQNPFLCQELFGGNYLLYRDPVFNMLWHPAALILSLLSPTFLRNALVDLYAMANVLLAVAGFRWLLGKCRAEGLVRVSSGTALFLSLSYGFSMYSLLMGSSGFWYLVNVAALPWLAGVWWEKKPGRIWMITTLAAFHNAVGGYPSCFLYSMGLVGLIGIWRVISQKEFRMAGHFIGAVCLAGVLSLPMIVPSLATLAESARGSALPVSVASEHRMPVPVILGSVFLGSGSLFFGNFELFGKVLHAYALACFTASWLVLASLVRKKWSSWDFALGMFLVIGALLVARPEWLGNLLYHVPVLGSLRWPHKEIYLLVFLLHLWAARGSDLSAKAVNLMGFAGALIFMASLFLAGPPSLNEHAASRNLLLNGEADRYWERVRSRMPVEGRIVSLMPDELTQDLPRYFRIPLILTGGGNFPAMYGVRSWSGYSATMPKEISRREPHPAHVVGIYRLSDRTALTKIPDLVFLELKEESPLEMILSSGAGGSGEVVYQDCQEKGK